MLASGEQKPSGAAKEWKRRRLVRNSGGWRERRGGWRPACARPGRLKRIAVCPIGYAGKGAQIRKAWTTPRNRIFSYNHKTMSLAKLVVAASCCCAAFNATARGLECKVGWDALEDRRA